MFENFSVNSLKGDLSNAITFNPPLFSLVNTFKDKREKVVSRQIYQYKGKILIPTIFVRETSEFKFKNISVTLE